jgi:hypothetical protein
MCLSAAAGLAGAQQAEDVVVRVRVVDSAKVPVALADLSVRLGLRDVQAQGTTDESGVRLLRVTRSTEQHELIVRRIGFLRASHFFAPSSDTTDLTITLSRQAQSLPTVKVNEREDPKRKSYHTDADEIANSSRLILDGMDVLTKMKPDILYGRSPGCGLQNIWVNGKNIRGVIPDEMVVARQGIKPSPRMKPSSGRPLPAPKIQSVSASLLTIMSEIKPEHIEEMNYVDCNDFSMPGTRGIAALYVVLKEGIGFDPGGRGSYVIDAHTP